MPNEPTTARRPRSRAVRILLVVVALLVAGTGALGVYHLDAKVDTAGEVIEATSLHWHGMHVPAAMDGSPRQTVAPGETCSPKWTVRVDFAVSKASTVCHCHLLTHEGEGMMGQFVVLGDGEKTGGIPRTGHDHP